MNESATHHDPAAHNALFAQAGGSHHGPANELETSHRALAQPAVGGETPATLGAHAPQLVQGMAFEGQPVSLEMVEADAACCVEIRRDWLIRVEVAASLVQELLSQNSPLATAS